MLGKSLGVVLSIILSGWVSVSGADTGYREGVDYERLEQPVAVDVAGGDIEVREFFSFGCPHCFQLEPYIDGWAKNKPSGTVFVKTPAVMRSSWVPQAHAYYVAQSLGKESEVSAALFDAIHVDKKTLQTESQLADFFAQFDVTTEQFDKLYNSFSIRVRIRQAEALAKEYRLSGVPVVIVNGKFLVTGSMSKSYERMMDIINFLVKKEKAKQVSIPDSPATPTPTPGSPAT